MCLLSKFIALNWQFITGISTTVIALCALAFSIWQGIQTRKHNMLSFMPHLTISTNIDKGFFSIDLINNGIGPALIEKFLVKVNDEVISGQGTEPIEKCINKIFPELHFTSSYGSISKDYSMAAKETVPILEIQFLQPYPYPSPEVIVCAFNRVSFQITYKSFYEEQFHFQFPT